MGAPHAIRGLAPALLDAGSSVVLAPLAFLYRFGAELGDNIDFVSVVIIICPYHSGVHDAKS